MRGWIEVVAMPALGVAVYVQGLIRDLQFDRRPTFLWRFHVPQTRDARLVGDVARAEGAG